MTAPLPAGVGGVCCPARRWGIRESCGLFWGSFSPSPSVFTRQLFPCWGSWSPEPPSGLWDGPEPRCLATAQCNQSNRHPDPPRPLPLRQPRAPGGRSHQPRAAPASCPIPGLAAQMSMLVSSRGPVVGARPLWPQGAYDPKGPLGSSQALKALRLAVSCRQEEVSVWPSSSPPVTRSGAQTAVLPPSGLGPGDSANCKVPLRPCAHAVLQVPALWRPNPHDCTNSPSCICIKIGCKEQLALH